ncbi:transglycosylase SLT domain-containing protein [Neiella marina]|uniref:Transglycosylase SLT domain-containing protein n=1 Tax=Neiella holothuriorum TaxID=2870530 RepID=A0ABS7EHM5_9GAMM|nr:transglycosylase SLT domain-containing protein [Neiella holothuriorum]MBW8191720.1 transglycosylase SLT domain-containing protein [Neiella holothuriorum]
MTFNFCSVSMYRFSCFRGPFLHGSQLLRDTLVLLGLSLLFVGPSSAEPLSSPAIIKLPVISDSQQQHYDQARSALRKGKVQQYKQHRQQLDDHPLAIYLDYHYLNDRVRSISANQVADFMARADGSPLAYRLQRRYLNYIGPKRRWRDYLTASPSEPTSTELRCYYHRAQLQQGSKEVGYNGAESLWLSGNSQPKACDVLFEEWYKAGLRTNEQLWKRMLLVFDARERGLLSYLSRKLSGDYHEYGQTLWSVYNNPKQIKNYRQFQRDSGENRAIISAALRKLARVAPDQAVKYWQHYQQALSFDTAHSADIDKQLIRYAYVRNNKKAIEWADSRLAELSSDDLTERRIRQLLKQQDWPALEIAIGSLSNERQQTERWQYWLARIEQQKGLSEAANQRLQSIASGRNYYSYLAAQQLDLDYQLANVPSSVDAVASEQLSQSKGLARIAALMAADQIGDANSEWIYLLRRSSDPERITLSHYALQQGWWHLAISSAIRAQAWDAIALRFPIAYQQDFEQFANMRAVDETLLMAIARRESSYNRYARSPKNARGLMQLMPATAKETARQINLRYRGVSSLYQPNTNIRLGSAYIKRLLKRFNQNRILAIASYNAGPHRINSWLKDDMPQPFDVWVETIPFRETRDYVQAVLAYQVIYALQTGQADFKMLRENELDGVY